MLVLLDFNKNPIMLKKNITKTVCSTLQCTDNKGFTLLEFLIAMAISGVVMAAISFAFLNQRKISLTQDAVVDMQQNIRASLLVMGNDLRMAGYDPDGHCSNAGFLTATGSTVSFVTCAENDLEDNNNDGNTDEPGETKQITYDFYDAYGDGINDIGRQVGSASTTKRAIAENIENLHLNYLDSDGKSTTDTAKIRSVQISILARSRRADLPTARNTTYSPPSDLASPVTWTYNDNIRRIYLSTTINCRNMGL